MSTATTDWEREALRLKGDGLSSAEIAEAVGKHPATIRKVLARAPEARAKTYVWNDGAVTDTEGHETADSLLNPPEPNGHGTVDAETAERLREAAGLNEPLDCQTDLSDFIAEAGEAVGPMPPREMDGGEIVHVEEIRVDGTTQLALDCGAYEVHDSKLSFSGSASVAGFYRAGDRIYGTFEAVVTDAGTKGKLDKKTGVFGEVGQNHAAKFTALTVDGWRNREA